MVLVIGVIGLLGFYIVCELFVVNYYVFVGFCIEVLKEKLYFMFCYYYLEKVGDLFVNLQWIELDIFDLVDVEDVVMQVFEVIYCVVLVLFYWCDFQQFIVVNRMGIFNLVNVCLEFGIWKFIYIFFIVVIGFECLFFNMEDVENEINKWSLNEDLSGYVVFKYLVEKEVWCGIEEGLNVVILNFSLLIGVGNWNDSLFKMF